jgi:predicted RNA-binding Zn ribbon-like protein
VTGAPAWTADDLPLLGEPAPVELANSLYGEGDERVDFLGTTALAHLWLAHADLGAPLPRRPGGADLARLRDLRDAVRTLVVQAVDGDPPDREAVATLNRAARLAPRWPQLTVERAEQGDQGEQGRGAPVLRATVADPPAGDGGSARFDVGLAHLAHDAIALLGGEDAARLRRCAAPDCGMAFVQHHRRRRWCHESCGHRIRQARYHRRKAQLTPREDRP